jgi:hypothetical protein
MFSFLIDRYEYHTEASCFYLEPFEATFYNKSFVNPFEPKEKCCCLLNPKFSKYERKKKMIFLEFRNLTNKLST